MWWLAEGPLSGGRFGKPTLWLYFQVDLCAAWQVSNLTMKVVDFDPAFMRIRQIVQQGQASRQKVDASRQNWAGSYLVLYGLVWTDRVTRFFAMAGILADFCPDGKPPDPQQQNSSSSLTMVSQTQ